MKYEHSEMLGASKSKALELLEKKKILRLHALQFVMDRFIRPIKDAFDQWHHYSKQFFLIFFNFF